MESNELLIIRDVINLCNRMLSVSSFHKHFIVSLAELEGYSVSIFLKVHFDLSNDRSIKMEEVSSLIVVTTHVTNGGELYFRFPLSSFNICLYPNNCCVFIFMR